jgi:hypothetical protein
VTVLCAGCGRIGFGDTFATSDGLASDTVATTCTAVPTLRQSFANGNGQQLGPTTWSTSVILGATQAGSTIICANWHKTTVANDTIASFTDDKGNPYSRLGAPIVADTMNFYDLWYTTNAAAGVRGFRVTLQTADAGYYNDEQCWEYSGLTTGAVDASTSGTATSDATRVAVLGTVTTSQAGDLVLVAFNQAGSRVAAAGTGYTLASMNDGSKYEWKIAGVAGVETATATTSTASQQIPTLWILALRCS